MCWACRKAYPCVEQQKESGGLSLPDLWSGSAESAANDKGVADMAILAQIGATLITGGQTTVNGTSVTFTNYIVERATDGTKDMESEDIQNEDGLWVTRLIFKRDKTAVLNLICKNSATPTTDFPDKAMCAYTGLTTYFVDECSVEKSKSAQRVSVKLTLLGTSA